MISEAELAKKIAKWQKTPDGKRRTKEYVDGLRATGGTTVSGQKVIGQKDMDNAAKILIEEIQRRLPESLKELGDSLVCTQAVKLADGQYEMAIRFSDPLHRDSLENDLGYDGIDNIVALFNNGYTAEEIVGLADYIAGEIDDTDTQYKLEQDTTDGHILKLSSKAKGGEWTVVATITTVDTIYDDTALAGKVTALEGLVGSDAVATQIANAIAALKLAETYATKNEVKAVSDAIAVLNGTGEGSVDKKVADAVAAIVADAPEAYDTLKEISDWISSHANDASAMNTQINTNKTDIAALKALVGELPESAEAKTVVAYIAEVVGASVGELGALASKDKVAKADLADVLKTELEGKANDADLAAVAKSGDVADLTQAEGAYFILNCGSATAVI